MFDLEILVKRWIRPSMVEVFIQQKFMFVKLSCVAQLLVQRAPASGVESERLPSRRNIILSDSGSAR